jgi:hypothetical protein
MSSSATSTGITSQSSRGDEHIATASPKLPDSRVLTLSVLCVGSLRDRQVHCSSIFIAFFQVVASSRRLRNMLASVWPDIIGLCRMIR